MSVPTSTNMPKKFDVADGGNSFMLGRRAFFNKTHESHSSANLGKSVDYSDVLGKKSSNVYAKPIPNKSADLRIQRLRLSAIGAGSTRLKDSGDRVQLAGKSEDVNLVDRARSRARSSGYVGPKR